MGMSRSSVALLILVNFLQVLNGGDCIIIGTYLGALPNGVRPPALSSIPTEVNFVLLGFAKDVSYNGNFQPFSEWTRLGITKRSITADKGNNPNRKYVISLGGAANFGGTFRIRQGLTVEQWVTNAVASISQIVTDLSADGVDIQVSSFASLAINLFPAHLRKSLFYASSVTRNERYFVPAITLTNSDLLLYIAKKNEMKKNACLLSVMPIVIHPLNCRSTLSPTRKVM